MRLPLEFHAPCGHPSTPELEAKAERMALATLQNPSATGIAKLHRLLDGHIIEHPKAQRCPSCTTPGPCGYRLKR